MTTPSDLPRDIANAGAAVAPPVAVSIAAQLHAFTPTDWMAIVTIGYVLLQAVYLIWKWVREGRMPVPKRFL